MDPEEFARVNAFMYAFIAILTRAHKWTLYATVLDARSMHGELTLQALAKRRILLSYLLSFNLNPAREVILTTSLA